MKARATPDRLARIALILLAARLACTALLVPPWAAFDEPYHQAYVEAESERLQWPAFRSLRLTERLVDSMREWPLPLAYATAFHGHTYGQAPSRSEGTFDVSNYETQQSPGYYWIAGCLIRSLPVLDPIAELYMLRLANGAFFFLLGVLTWAAARAFGFGDRAWMPVAFLALVPGGALAMARVSNDALCALLIGAAVFPLLEADASPGRSLGAAAAAGLAPWVKLYGAVCIPVAIGHVLFARRRRLTAARLSLLALLPASLLLLSWKIHGHALSLQENLLVVRSPGLFDVPWLQDAWTVAKTYVWVSGMSFLVFPKIAYLAPLLLLAASCLQFLRLLQKREASREREGSVILLALLASFAVALGYHAWRNFAMYGGGGGTGGWYLWAMALPSSLLVTLSVARSRDPRRLIAAGAAVFGSLLVAGDLIFLAIPTGRVNVGGQEVLGWRSEPLSAALESFLTSRPAAVSWAALGTMAVSWLLIVWLVLEALRPEPLAGEGP